MQALLSSDGLVAGSTGPLSPLVNPPGQLSFLVEDEPLHAAPVVVPQVATVNILDSLLKDKRSEATKRAYEGDLRLFFSHLDKMSPVGYTASAERIKAFCSQPAPVIALQLSDYKNALILAKNAEATVNRRIAAVRSLLKFAHRLGMASTDGRALIDGERTRSYRNTAGIPLPLIKQLLAAPSAMHGENSIRGLRDTAILKLMFGNGLRRKEVCLLNVGDFSLASRRLAILGKGRGAQKTYLTISEEVASAIITYLAAAGHLADIKGPLFRNLHHDPSKSGEGLTGDGLYFLIGEYGRFIGLDHLTPHQLRHSAITILSKATNGNTQKVKEFSRHSDVNTVQIYIHNADDEQGEMSNLLSDLAQGKAQLKTAKRRNQRFK